MSSSTSGPSGASAQTSSAETADPSVIAAARALAVEGVKLAQAGRCAEAIDPLERAEQLFHGPIVLAQLGECYVQVGRLVEGSEALRAVLREPLPDDASDTLKRAHASARTTLDATKDQIAQLTLRIHASQDAAAEVSIDGKPVPAALLDVPRPTDPGEHSVEAQAPGHLAAKRKLTLEPGESAELELTLKLDPTAQNAPEQASNSALAEAAAPPPPAPAAATPQDDPTLSSRWPAYVAWGVAAVGLGTGVGFGWAAVDQKGNLDRACPERQCPRAQRAKLDAARTNGVISTVGYSVALGGALLGGALFYLANDGDAHETATASVGPTGAELTVRF